MTAKPAKFVTPMPSPVPKSLSFEDAPASQDRNVDASEIDVARGRANMPADVDALTTILATPAIFRSASGHGRSSNVE